MRVSHILICLVSLSLFAIPASADLNITSISIINTGDIRTPWSPAWSPDGNSIDYVAYDASNNQQIFMINIDGSGKKQVTSDITKKWGLTWLDEDISFLSYDTDGLEKIFLIHPDGSGLRKLLDEKTRQGLAPEDKPPASGGASWNLVKKTILFTSFDPVTNDEKVFEVNLDGTGKKEVVMDDLRQWNPSWSPDGNSFVYVSYDSKNNLQLFTASADGTNKTQITSDGLKKYDPTWGQGGILYVSTETATSSGDKLFIINPDGTGKKLVLEDGYKQENPRWSRDGSKIIYEDIDTQGNLAFKVLNLQKPASVTPAVTTPSPTPTPTPTLTATASPTATMTPTPTASVTPKETPAPGALKSVVYSMLLVLGIIVVVMVAILLISNLLSKKK